MHLFLTGAIGVGKSTLLRALLARTGRTPGGFRTCWDPTGQSLYLLSWDWTGPLRPRDRAARRTDRCAQALPGRFDRLGPPLLVPRPGQDLLIMDELGFLERDALRFQRAVLDALDGPLPVLGVIKPRPSPFLDAVRAHPLVRIVPVTTADRDALRASLDLEAVLTDRR
ncbi:nucleoside-triphosphatase [Pseudoflavonifractor sp. MSJ-37]|uniref:nucleoside-triphosphatase n=1 Tax=Pseudoflavonifractor sp. MSJ-37 TaxID=2841531 RepID=UPI001C12378D|nr:nucleoside-triphosphatase [Pseudoflavonifractor sp. MSJ-37]MBU5436334.1 nucleoside-triphosphatase [Pseudoflavonifractor sp. MSJ-37]